MIYILLCKGSIVDRVMMPTWLQLASQKSTKIQKQSRPRALPILASFFDRFKLLYTLGSIMTIWKYVSVSYGFAWPWGVGYSLGPGEPWITRARNLGLPWGSGRTTNHDLAWYFENTASKTSFLIQAGALPPRVPGRFCHSAGFCNLRRPIFQALGPSRKSRFSLTLKQLQMSQIRG